MPEVHPSVAAAHRDQATVTSDGRSLANVIDGVKTHAPVVHADHRGRLFEVYPGPNEFWTDPVVYCYFFSVRPQQTKGWGLHERKVDRYTLMSGEVLTVLFDARADSPTQGVSQRVVLSPDGVRQLLIPTGVWHININLSPVESLLINHPTETYVHGQPDRLLLPWDSSAIPVDIGALFPTQVGHGDRSP